MTLNPKAKLKTLYIRRILEEETDENHGLSMRQLIERLAEVGITAERKSVYRDIEILREFGADIQTYQRNPVEYAIVRRDFGLDELMLLIDAVESCKALTKRQAKALTTNLKLMASDHQRALLDRRIHVVGRIKSKEEGVFDKIDLIHRAMHERRKVTFKYYHIGPDGKKRASHDDAPYVVTPVAISYDEGFYYLTAWDDELEGFREFRLDRMQYLAVSDTKATRKKEISHYEFEGCEHEYFGRFDGDRMTVTLRVDEDKTEIILDRFGDAAEIYPQKDGSAKAVVKVRKSPQFFGWIAGMAGTVRIEEPKKLKEEYKKYLGELMKD